MFWKRQCDTGSSGQAADVFADGWLDLAVLTASPALSRHPASRCESDIIRSLRRAGWIMCFVAAAAALSCATEPAGSLPPAGAQTTADGVRWLRVKKGTGRLGAQAEWWSVTWRDVPCPYECEHVYNGHRGTELYDPFRSNLLSMKEGEVRRLWIPRRDNKERFWTADVELYEVYATASAGGPLIPPVPPPKFPVQPYARRPKAPSRGSPSAPPTEAAHAEKRSP